MKLNLGLNISRLIRDISKGKPIKLTNYVWSSISQSIKPTTKKK